MQFGYFIETDYADSGNEDIHRSFIQIQIQPEYLSSRGPGNAVSSEWCSTL